jgi:hypothetical protein
MATSAKNLSLWTVIEAMQQRLEREGLDAAVVDAAVALGIEALLRCDRKHALFLTGCACGEC